MLASHPPNLIEFHHVHKAYGAVTVIEDLSLHVARGELLVVMGASGSGKSTLLKMINRLETHDAGQMLFDGQAVEQFAVRDLRLRMGYAIQSVGLFPHWTVERNIATVPAMLGWSGQKIQARVTELLALLDLEPGMYRGRYPHELSGGQQQRVGVARALAADPDVLLMDEPFGALDPVNRTALQEELLRVHRASGSTIVLVTHDVDEALRLASRIVLLDQGRVLQVGTPMELLTRPAHALVEDFVGRSDLGIKLLSLIPARGLACPQPAGAGPTVLADVSLREVVSCMAAHQVSQVNLVDVSGTHLGVLHADAIFSGALAQHA